MSKRNITFETFAGEYVSMLTKMTIEQSVSQGEMIETVKTPISVKGFFVEQDDNNYYLGIAPGLINQSVQISEVVHIEIVQEEADIMGQLLEDGEIPPGDKFN